MAQDTGKRPFDAALLGQRNHAELMKLRYHWGDGAYRIEVEFPHSWTATRLDDEKVLAADSAADLREKIVEDYSARPVPRGEPDS
jgi:hypothetical protein